MTNDNITADWQDDSAVARIMIARINHAIDLAREIGAERLADMLIRAREAAEREAGAKRSAEVD